MKVTLGGENTENGAGGVEGRLATRVSADVAQMQNVHVHVPYVHTQSERIGGKEQGERSTATLFAQ